MLVLLDYRCVNVQHFFHMRELIVYLFYDSSQLFIYYALIYNSF